MNMYLEQRVIREYYKSEISWTWRESERWEIELNKDFKWIYCNKFDWTLLGLMMRREEDNLFSSCLGSTRCNIKYWTRTYSFTQYFIARNEIILSKRSVLLSNETEEIILSSSRTDSCYLVVCCFDHFEWISISFWITC